MADGSIAYHAAAVGVVYEPEDHSQRHYINHKDDITAIGFHPERRLVVTGEVGRYPMISIWDSLSMEEVKRVKTKL